MERQQEICVKDRNLYQKKKTNEKIRVKKRKERKKECRKREYRHKERQQIERQNQKYIFVANPDLLPWDESERKG